MKHIWSGLFLASIMTICLALTAAAADVPSAKLTVTPSDDGSQYTVSVSADAAIGSIQFTLPEEYSGSVEVATAGYDEESHSDDTFAYIGFSEVNDTFIAAGTADGLTETEILTFIGDEIGSAADLLTNVEIGGLDGLTKFDTTVTGGGAGCTVSGTVKSVAGHGDTVTVRLLDGGAEIASAATAETSYTLENVPTGEYIMEVSRQDHVTRQYEVTVEGDTTFDAEIWLLGDVSGDGKVNVVDSTKVMAQAKNKGTLSGYAFACGDVNSDGKINVVDSTKVLAQAKNKKVLW